jgi:cephalosporin hydroxylase
MPHDRSLLGRLTKARRILAAHTRRRTEVCVRRRFLLDYYDAGNLDVGGGTWKDTWWMGVPVQKWPTDLWLYQELLHGLRPDVIIECGTAFGGSALYLGGLCDLLDNGQIISNDTDEWYITVPGYDGRKEHPRVTYLLGSSVDPAIVDESRRGSLRVLS